MVKMSANKKKALQTVFKYSKTTFLWGFIPFVVYLGKYIYVQQPHHKLVLEYDKMCLS